MVVGEGFWLVQKAAVQGGVAVQAAVRVMVCVGKGVCVVLRWGGGGCLRAGLCGRRWELCKGLRVCRFL